MNRDDTRRLELARRAYLATAPSFAEVERSAARVRRALREGRSRRRRSLPLLSLALLLIGASAYAAYRANSWRGEAEVQSSPGSASHTPAALSDRPTSRGAPLSTEIETPGASDIETPRATASAVGAELSRTPKSEPTPSDRGGGTEQNTGAPSIRAPSIRTPSISSSSTAGSPSRGSSSRPPSSTSPGSATPANWTQVEQALARGDSQAAAAALERLAEQGPASARLDARLGLAQLAVSRGDCSQARGVARELLDEPALSEASRRRARSIVARCAD